MCHKCVAILLPQDEWLAVNLEGGCDDSLERVIWMNGQPFVSFQGNVAAWRSED